MWMQIECYEFIISVLNSNKHKTNINIFIDIII